MLVNMWTSEVSAVSTMAASHMLFKWLGPPFKSTNKFQSIQPYYMTTLV